MSYERGNGLTAEEKAKEGAVKKKYEFMEDLPGIGPATAQKLRRWVFTRLNLWLWLQPENWSPPA
jgi:hypothetical protein